MRLFLLLVVLVGCRLSPPWEPPAACEQAPEADEQTPLSLEPLRLVGDMGYPDQPGETFFTLTGGRLSHPVAVPLFFQFQGEDPDDKCSLHNEAFFFELADGRVHVGQYNSWCGGSACRILDPKDGSFREPPSPCLPWFGVHYRVESLGEGFVVVYSDSEGAGSARFGTYSAEAGFSSIREVGMGNTGWVKAQKTPEGFLLTSPCDLTGKGCVFSKDYEGAKTRRFLLTAKGALSALD